MLNTRHKTLDAPNKTVNKMTGRPVDLLEGVTSLRLRLPKNVIYAVPPITPMLRNASSSSCMIGCKLGKAFVGYQHCPTRHHRPLCDNLRPTKPA